MDQLYREETPQCHGWPILKKITINNYTLMVRIILHALVFFTVTFTSLSFICLILIGALLLRILSTMQPRLGNNDVSI